MKKSLILSSSWQKVSINCYVPNSINTKFLLEVICMVIIVLRISHPESALAKSFLSKSCFCSFMNIF